MFSVHSDSLASLVPLANLWNCHLECYVSIPIIPSAEKVKQPGPEETGEIFWKTTSHEGLLTVGVGEAQPRSSHRATNGRATGVRGKRLFTKQTEMIHFLCFR